MGLLIGSDNAMTRLTLELEVSLEDKWYLMMIVSRTKFVPILTAHRIDYFLNYNPKLGINLEPDK